MSFRGTEIKIFSGSSNYIFTQNIASHLGLPLGKAEIKTFNDGEIAVSLCEPVRNSDCFIVQSICNPVNDNLMELLVMIDAMKRACATRILLLSLISGTPDRTEKLMQVTQYLQNLSLIS